MAEKIKRTHAERDALLSKVFDSTLQTKDIEITEAGTMEITPDEGFFALKKVNLNVNVQGGSGGEGGGDSNVEYLNFKGIDWKEQANMSLIEAVALGGQLIKLNGLILSVGYFMMQPFTIDAASSIEAVSFDFSTKINYLGETTIGAMFSESLKNVPRITKEEFYAL